nr:MAG TPA: tail protein [Bacteriophage sp.]
MVRKLAEATGSISISMRGEKGESGDTPYVTKTVVDYAITSSVSEAKKWYSTAPDASAAANKGKFLWTRTTYTWSNNKTTDNITYTYIGKDGKDGTSVTIKGSKGSTSELPTSGNTLGDGYIIGGYLWVYTGTSKTDSTHAKGFENVGKIQGEPGAAATQYYTHVAWMKDSKGTGFTTTAGGGKYAYFGVLVDKNPNAPSAAGDWVKYDWSYVKGATGATGNGIKSTEVTYQIGSSGTIPPTDGVWDTKIPNITDKKPYLWTRTIFKYTNGTDSKPSYSVATRGTKGALMREHDGFESGKYKYLSGSGAEEYIDVVCINGKWWQCIVTYDDKTDTPSLDDGHWKEMNNYKSIATHLLLAENATINMLGTNQINLFNPTTGGKMYGSFRVVKDVNDWSLWLGGENGDSASFAVRRNGYLKATNADISGRIDATSGSIAGFNINKNSIGSIGQTEGMSLSNKYLQFMNQAYLHGEGYFVACGNFLGTGLRINSVTSAYNDLSTGIRILIDAGTSTPSGKMCTALDLCTRWADQAGSFDMTNPYEGNHAIVISGGDVIGLRPSFVRLAASDSLTEYHHTVECYNSSTITLTLPSSPKYGQCYTIIQRRSRVIFSSDKGIYDVRRASSATTWYSDTVGQVSWLWYNGSQWIVCYTTN